MPPKPRGLAASRSKKVIPVETVVRTAPLDEDHLSISDLVELRQSALELLHPPNSAAAADDESKTEVEREDEARGLLRGILHACQALLTLVESTRPTVAELQTETATSEGSLHMALGLTGLVAKGQLLYLQASALHELSAILPSPPSALASSSAAGDRGGSKKKRKLDSNEPVSALDWVELALEKYEIAAAELERAAGQQTSRWLAITRAEWSRALCDRAALELNVKEPGPVAGKYMDAAQAQLQEIASQRGVSTVDEPECDVETSLLRSYAALLALIEAFPTLSTRPLDAITFINTSLALPHLFDIQSTDSLTLAEDVQRRAYDVVALQGDCKMVEFILREEEIEDKYRPEQEDEDEDAEPTDLPDEEDVRAAKLIGESSRVISFLVTGYALLTR